MKQLKPKFLTENMLRVQVDKGKTIVIIKGDSYNEVAARHP